MSYGGDGRRFQFSDAARDKEGLRGLLMEGERMMKFMWRFVIEKGSLDFESVGLLPIVSMMEVRRSHQNYKPTWNAAFLR